MMLDNRRLSKCKEVNLNNLKNWMLNRYVVSTMLLIFSPQLFRRLYNEHSALHGKKSNYMLQRYSKILLDNTTFYNELCSKSLFSVAF